MTNAIRDDNNVPVMLGVSAVDGSVQPLQIDENGAIKTSATLSGDVTAGTEYDEDAAAAANPKGGMLIAVRRDTLSASEVSADGDNIALKATNKGQLHVKLADASDVNLQAGDGTDVTQTAGALDINIKTSDVAMGGGTQYTEGDTDASITGTAAMWEDASNTLRAVSSTYPLPVTLATKLDKVNDSVTSRPEATTFTNITASAIVSNGACILVGMYVNSTSSGTIKLWNNTAASGTVINNTITPAIGFHNLGMTYCSTGVYATIANTLDVTLYVIPIS